MVKSKDMIEIDRNRRIADLLNSGKDADFTIKCGTKEWKVHSTIIRVHSTFFDKACAGPFKEATSRVIELPEEDPVVVQAMLEFMYKGSYEVGSPNVPRMPKQRALEAVGKLPKHSAVYMAGDKYDVKGLMEFATHQIEAVTATIKSYT